MELKHTEVTTFFAPGLGKWIIRSWYKFGRDIDRELDHDPTDAELRAMFNPDIKIRRGYMI